MPAAPAAVTSPRVRLLVIDDHAMVRQGLCGLWEHCPDLGIVGRASDGVEAVALVEQLQPTVVLMDVNMPRMSGIEATARIKERSLNAIVVGLSVNASQETRNVMIKVGASLLVSKEAAVDQLYGMIRKAVTPCGTMPISWWTQVGQGPESLPCRTLSEPAIGLPPGNHTKNRSRSIHGHSAVGFHDQ